MEREQPLKEEYTSPIYFWRPHEDHGYLGQWFPSPFTSQEITFPNCETYMMYHKALLFSDPAIASEILNSTDPKEVKALGRKVQNFDDEVWKQKRFDIVVEANRLKFAQNEELKKMLLETGGRELIEASPRDKIWGIGFGKASAEKMNKGDGRKRWGMNLLGKALMVVREALLLSTK